MKKKLLSLILTICLALLVFAPKQVYAMSNNELISNKKYDIAPGVVEYERVTNNSDLSAQLVGHVMEVTLGGTAEIRIGYNDYNIETFASSRGWGMRRTTEQAQALETRTGLNVVGAVNGDFFNMSNGEPTGTVYMQGVRVKDPNGTPYFYIDSEGKAHIETENLWSMPEGVKEAINVNKLLVKDGQVLTGDEITNPRTAIGIKADGTVVLYMVDGRQAPYSVGVGTTDLAIIMQSLGCVIAGNLDGGGSSTFATQREGEANDNGAAGLTLRCRPSDGYERTVSTTIMVISNEVATGEFDHASISPSEEIYTPGSQVQFNATGVDAAGGAATLPENGLKWVVVEGSELGTINETTGLFTGKLNAVGTVTVGLEYNEKIVGSATIELQWPDKLAFENTSVSLDFGETSDLTFVPTYKGREVNYKDGDFKWKISEENLTYKQTVSLEEYYTPFWQAASVRWVKLNLNLTGNEQVGDIIHLTYQYEDKLLYDSKYEETSRTISEASDGTINVTEVLTHKGATLYNYDNPTEVAKANITSDFGPETISSKAYGIRNLKAVNTFNYSLGKFSNNQFTADENSSIRGKVVVSLNGNEATNASIDLVVGMEPYVLMDFEDKKDATGGTILAKDYWNTYIGKSSNGGMGQLTAQEVKNYKLWVRSTSGLLSGNSREDFPSENRIVSADEEPNIVRFGNYAYKLTYDFSKYEASAGVAVHEFGFSGDLLVNTVQPTKLGMWINVPEDCKYDNSVLKAILKGGAYQAALDTAYMILNEDGSISYVDGNQLTGTTSYVQYYSYDSEGNVTGSCLMDWAGKGWTWVEADMSAFQMPVDLCRGYTVRITSPQNYGVIEGYNDAGEAIITKKGKGYIYIDNLQFIYGTNTNDINKPEISTVTEKTSGKDLNGNPEFNSEILTFEMTFTDNKVTDKYATGIDESSIRVYIDGYDMSESLEVTAGGGSAYLYNLKLKNGIHNIKIRVKDVYGNETIETYYFTVNDPKGTSAEISVVPVDEKPIINKQYKLKVVNNGNSIVSSAEVSVNVLSTYVNKFTVTAANGYTASSKVEGNNIIITITKNSSVAAEGSELAYITFDIPSDSKEGDSFTYSVPSGMYIVGEERIIFSDIEKSNRLYAEYKLSANSSIVGFETLITVNNDKSEKVSGAKIYLGETLLGTTDENGTVKYTFTNAGRITLYAINDSGRSWNVEFVVNSAPDKVSAEQEGYPFGISPNGVKDGSSEFNVTWLTAISGVKDAQSYIRYSNVYKTSEELANVTNVLGTNELITFTQTNTGEAYRINNVSLKGLKANTTYYYQVGTATVDNEIKWSNVLTFTTSPSGKEDETNFFILGDIQSDDTANLSYALNMINYNANYAGYKMNFGIQTGDAIDDVTKFNNWRSFLTTINASTLHGVPLIHTLGNHEYYGDNNGLVSGAMYGLNASAQGSFYSYEYGSIYVGVINNGGNILDAIEALKEDVKKTECAWKVVVMHEPIYGTESFMEESKRLKVVAGLEEAGIDFVFAGDDHAYARTYELKGDKKVDNPREGITYYIVGDLSSKNNTYNENNEYYAYSKPHNEYVGMYIQVRASKEEITITAVQYNGEVPYDIYTERKTDCELGKHTYNKDSKFNVSNNTIGCTKCDHFELAKNTNYNGRLSVLNSDNSVVLENGVVKCGWFEFDGEMKHTASNGILHEDSEGQIYRYDVENGKVVCAICNEEAADHNFTGKLKTVDGKNEVMFGGGILKVGWFAFGEDMLHADEKGIIHETKTYDTATCLENGHIEADCITCKEHYKSETITWSKGHTWNDEHICTVCQKEGIDISKIQLVIPNNKVSYTGGQIKPSSYAQYAGKYLVARSDRYGTDAYVSYSNNIEVGMGKVIYEGRGNFYGTLSNEFEICPADVTNLKYTNTKTSITLSWNASGGSTSYVVYEKIDGEYVKVQETTETSLTISGLEMGSYHTYIVRGKAVVSEKEFLSLSYTELSTETLVDNTFNSISSIKVTTNTGIINMLNVEGKSYILLPTACDLAKLNIELVGLDNTDSVSVGGDKGSKLLEGNATEINLLNVCSKNPDASYTLVITNGDRDALNIIVRKSENIHSIHITSNDKENAGREYVDSVKGNKASGTIKIYNGNSEVVYDGDLKQIKARGNSTYAYFPKKSYQIKLTEGADLLGNGESVATWVLLANYADSTLMHDKLMKDLAKKLGEDFVASCDFADLYYDGEYRGSYLITEKNYVGETGVDITDLEDAFASINENYGNYSTSLEGINKYGFSYKYIEGLNNPTNITGGYLIELNNTAIDEICGFMTRKGVAFNVKSPEYASDEAMKYISEYYQEFEDAVFATDDKGNYTGYNSLTGKYYYDYIDLDSLVKAFLLQELSGNCDAFVSSMYLYKDVDGKLNAGLIWDNDMVFGTGWVEETAANKFRHNYLADALIKIPGFEAKVKEYYTNTLVPEIKLLISDKGTISSLASKLSASAEMNYILWPFVNVGYPEHEKHLWENATYQTVINDMKNWINSRFFALNNLYCNHIYSDEYESNSQYHWHVCTICGKDGSFHVHSYSNNCDTMCDYCGNIRLVQHLWDSGKVTKEATCENDGRITYTCSLCSETKFETIKKTGHKYSESWSSDENNHYHECENCSSKKDSEKHSWDSGKVVKEATCEADGEKVYTCTVCGATKKEVINKLNHKYSESWSSDENNHYHECENCSSKKDSEEHSWDSGKVVKEATCEADGEKVYTCTVCSATKKEVINKLNHKYSENWSSDENNHYYECENCSSKKDSEEHSWDSGKVVKEATCETDGEKVYTCTVCGATKKEVINKLNHKYSESWSSDENNHYHECENCSSKKDLEEHSWDSGKITQAATKDEEGIKTYTCTVCGATKTEAIPTTGCKSTTQCIWFILSVLGLAFVIRRKRLF